MTDPNVPPAPGGADGRTPDAAPYGAPESMPPAGGAFPNDATVPPAPVAAPAQPLGAPTLPHTFNDPNASFGPAGGAPVGSSAPYSAPTAPHGEQPAPFGAQPERKRKLNVLALVAMIVSLVGFLFACLPGALIVGWILLPIGFVLSIVSLFLKGDKKWFGIVGLVASIVGTVVGFIVFFAVVANSFNEAFGSGDTVVTQPSDAEEEEEPATTEEEPAAEAAQGSRENPYPLASTISSEEWTVVVNSYNPDGNATVTGNMFNEAPPAGSHYEIVNYTVTYTGAESSYAAEVGLDLLTSAGNVVNSFDNLVILDDGMGLDELYAGGSATGSVAFLVPDGETVVIRVRPGMFADEVFVQP